MTEEQVVFIREFLRGMVDLDTDRMTAISRDNFPTYHNMPGPPAMGEKRLCE